MLLLTGCTSAPLPCCPPSFLAAGHPKYSMTVPYSSPTHCHTAHPLIAIQLTHSLPYSSPTHCHTAHPLIGRFFCSLRADREKAHEAALAAKQKQEEAEEEAQRQVDKTERIRLAKLKQEKDDARTNMRTIRKVEGEAWAVVDAERQQKKDKQLRNRAKLQRRQEREHQVALEAKQEADRIKSEETTEEGRRNLHQMWAVEEAFFQKKCEELAQAKANKKKQERKAKRKHEAEMRRQAEQEEKARLEHREQALLHKSASQAMWDRDYQTRRARIKAAADKEQAEAQALAQRKKWIADQNACQRDERYNLTCQVCTNSCVCLWSVCV